MAWTEQCKIAFRTSAEHFVNQGQGLRETLRILSSDSGIPYNTLKDWYFKKTVVENHNTDDWPICEDCGTRKVRRQQMAKGFKYYPKCTHCYRKEKILITCPHCGKSFELMEGKHEIG